jgi:hypothetical protein
MLSQIQGTVVRRPGSSALVASLSAPSPMQFQVSGQPSRSGGGLVLSVKVILATIDTFYGGDKRSRVVDPKQFIAFTKWFDAVAWKLQVAGIPSEQHVASICQALGGAILRMFIQTQRVEGCDTFSLNVEQLRSKLTKLFSEAGMKFASAALDMRFNATKLAQSLHEFRSYILNSSMANNVDRNKFIRHIEISLYTISYGTK